MGEPDSAQILVFLTVTAEIFTSQITSGNTVF